MVKMYSKKMDMHWLFVRGYLYVDCVHGVQTEILNPKISVWTQAYLGNFELFTDSGNVDSKLSHDV